MKIRILPLLFCLFIACTGGNKKPGGPQASTENSGSEGKVKTELFEFSTEGHSFDKMKVFPVMATELNLKKNASMADYKNLKEAIEGSALAITEMGTEGSEIAFGAEGFGAGRVNSLTMENTSDDTVFVMYGDVVQGGKQDRVIASDQVIPPNSGKVAVGVFCVEQGRWEYKRKDNANQFNYHAVASNSVRKSAKYEKSQMAVWDKVEQLNVSNNAYSPTGTIRALESSEEFTKSQKEYKDFFSEKFDDSENVVGMVVTSGDSVLGCDIFATPKLFRKQYKNLINAYITDAITYGTDVQIDSTVVAGFVTKSFKKYSAPKDTAEAELSYKLGEKTVHFSDL